MPELWKHTVFLVTMEFSVCCTIVDLFPFFVFPSLHRPLVEHQSHSFCLAWKPSITSNGLKPIQLLMNTKLDFTNYTGSLTYFLAWSSPMLLNNTSKHRGKTPWSCGDPVMVWVFPEEVTPYANNKAKMHTHKKLLLALPLCIRINTRWQ